MKIKEYTLAFDFYLQKVSIASNLKYLVIWFF